MNADIQNDPVNFLKIPVSVLPEDDISGNIRSLIKNQKKNHIVFLTFSTLMKARHHEKTRKILEEAALVVPVSKLISWGFEKVFRSRLPCYHPFPFIIRTLNVINSFEQTVYLFGSNEKTLRVVEEHLASSFPSARIIGRCTEKQYKELKTPIFDAIRKANPSLLLVHKPKKGDAWLFQNRSRVFGAVQIWNRKFFSIVSGKTNKKSEYAFSRTLRAVFSVVIKPWRIFSLFTLLYYLLLVFAAGRRQRKADLLSRKENS